MSDLLERAFALWFSTGDLDAVRREFASVAPEVEELLETRRRLAAMAASLAPAETPNIPDYRIERVLGHGAFSVVYEAEQIKLRRRVALKVLRRSPLTDPVVIERFQREAIAVANLQHEAIVPVYHHGEVAGTLFIAMELCGESSLAEVIAAQPRHTLRAPKRGRSAFTMLAVRFAELADGLAHAHAQGLLHRDVKPSNVLVTTTQRLRLLDFGLASSLGCDRLTRSGQPIGSPHTMAPEQARGDRAAIGPWSDVYGLGATLYETLTGQPVFTGDSMAEVVAKVLAGEFVPLQAIDARIPSDLVAIVEQCLRLDPAERYRCAADLAHDLRAFAANLPVQASRRRRRASVQSFVRRRARPLVVVVTVMLGAAVLLLTLHRTKAELQQAQVRSAAVELQSHAHKIQERILDQLDDDYRRDAGSKTLGPALAAMTADCQALVEDDQVQTLYAGGARATGAQRLRLPGGAGGA